MALSAVIRNFLMDSRRRGVDVDSLELLEVHRQVLMEKKLMREVFHEFYRNCVTLVDTHFKCEGEEIELGSGVSLFQDFHPCVVTSDIKPYEHVNRVLDAQKMDCADETVRAFYGINCFHHFPLPRQFFKELERVLKPGGGCVLIEPYYGPFSKFIYKRIHAQEHFNTKQINWETEKETAAGKMGAMSGANQALSYIVFIRDRKIFEQEFPNLEIVVQKPLKNYLRYLLSGGVNFRQLIPNWFSGPTEALEFLLTPVLHLFALHHYIVIRKK